MSQSNSKPQNVVVEMIPFGRKPPKVTIAREATEKESAAYALGFDLGAEHAESSTAWTQALRQCADKTARASLRAGFVAGYAPFCANVKAAQNRFDYLARMFAPAHTSRKAKSNEAKAKAKAKTKAGRPTKESAAVEKLSEKRVVANVVAALAYIADAQQTHAADGDMLEVLGAIAKILTRSK